MFSTGTNQDSLKGPEFLTMCSVCKGIRLNGEWLSLERFLLSYHTEIRGISHSICPTCAIKHYQQFLQDAAGDMPG